MAQIQKTMACFVSPAVVITVLVCLLGNCHLVRGVPIAQKATQRTAPSIIPKSGTAAARNKIIGGSEAPQNKYPWMAQIQVRTGWFWGRWRFQCGGSLIARKFVITAKHCVNGKNARKIRVILGDHDRTQPDVGEQVIYVRRYTKHSTADLAILELKSEASITAQVKPIQYVASEPGVGTDLTVAGWGRTQSSTQNSLANKLQHLVIPVTADSDCNNQLPPQWIVKPDEFCAGENTATYTNVCHGDSGGPAMINIPNIGTNGYLLLGVVARGTPGCPANVNYAVFQSFRGHGSWIKQITGVDPACFPGDATVMLASGDKKRMDHVTTGDKILALTPEGSLVYSDVIMMMHEDSHSVSEYLTIHTEDQDVALRISAEHMVYVLKTGEQKADYKFAETVKIGDQVFLADGYKRQSLRMLAVVNVTHDYHTGAFAPLTLEGTVVVDGVVASSYAYLESQTLCHLALWPVRLAHTWAPHLLTPGKAQYPGQVHWAPELIQSITSPLL